MISEKCRNQGLAAVLLALLCCPALGDSTANTTTLEQNKFLFPEARHENIGELVSQFIQNSHYNQVAVDDELSSKVLDLYIETLDRNRMYLLANAIEFFEKYRYELDDIVKSEPLDPVYEIFEVYQTRLRERLAFALSQLENEPDYTTNVEYRFDRSEASWATSAEELNTIWRQRVINDALNLAIEDEPWEKIQEILTKRYKGSLRRLGQVTTTTFLSAL